jgi:hypothetical protein
VTAPQAEALMVALQLGKIQLTLRNAGDVVGAAPQKPLGSPPTWGADVSPALRSLDGGPAAGSGQPASGPVSRPSMPVEVMHGDKKDTRCFNQAGQPAADCTALGPAPPAALPPASPAIAPPPASSNRTN